MPEYVSPIDERVVPHERLARRPSTVAGRHVVLLDIRKNRGDEFLDRLGELLAREGAVTSRQAKEIFSKPASAGVIDETARRADLVVEALAD